MVGGQVEQLIAVLSVHNNNNNDNKLLAVLLSLPSLSILLTILIKSYHLVYWPSDHLYLVYTKVSRLSRSATEQGGVHRTAPNYGKIKINN